MKINTKLEEEFDLAPMSLNEEEPIKDLIPSELAPLDRYKELNKIDAALPLVRGLESTDQELDEIAVTAMNSYKELMDLAMNIEQRFVGEVAGAASNMLGHALNARTNKIKKKLDLISLQIKKQVADGKVKSTDDATPIDGTGTVLSRNELLDHLLGTKTVDQTK
jgi:hypothetical protein